MNSRISKLFAASGIVLTLGACASLPGGEPSESRLAQIHPGLTQDEVLGLVGKPGNTTGSPRSGALWIYSFTDTWGYASEFDVTFDRSGVVTRTDSERLDY